MLRTRLLLPGGPPPISPPLFPRTSLPSYHQVTFKDCVVGDLHGSSPWAFKLKMADGAGGGVHNVSVVDTRFGVIAPNSYQQPKGGTAIILVGSYSATGACHQEDSEGLCVVPGGGPVPRGGERLTHAPSGPLLTPPLLQQPTRPARARAPAPSASTYGSFPVASDIVFMNVSLAGCEVVGSLTGMPGVNLTDIVFQNFNTQSWNKAREPWECQDISGTVVLGEVVPSLPAACGV